MFKVKPLVILESFDSVCRIDQVVSWALSGTGVCSELEGHWPRGAASIHGLGPLGPGSRVSSRPHILGSKLGHQ